MKIRNDILLCLLCIGLFACQGGIEITNANLPSTNLDAQPGNAKAYVSWDQIANVPDYIVYKTSQIDIEILVTIDLDAITTLEKFTALFDSLGIAYDSESVTGLTLEEEGLTNGMGYCYAVVGAYNGYGPLSNTDCVVPIGTTVPTALATSLAVLVEWAKVNGAASYNLYWKSILPSTSTSLSKAVGDDSDYELVANIEDTGASEYSYNHTGRSNCTDDYYIIKPVNQIGEEGQDVQETSASPRTEGVFDTDFGDAGIVIRNSRNGDFVDLAFLSDGSIVALFSARAGDTNRIFKFSSDGTYIDNVDVDARLPNDVNALAVDADDNIYAVNSVTMNVCKYNSDLQLVTSYGTGGCFESGIADSYGYDLAIDSSGRVLVTGVGDSVANNVLTVWRLATDGSLDNTFDSDGLYSYPTHDPPFETRGIGLTIVDGVIYITGYYWLSFIATYEFLILTLNESDGSYISEAIDAGQGPPTSGKDIKVLSDGTLLAVGLSGASASMYLWNYDSDLTLLESHAYNYTTGAGAAAGGNGLLVDCIGNPVVAGYDGAVVFPDIAVVRTNTEFTLDDAFGNQDPVDGWFLYDYVGERDVANKVIEDAMGRLFVAGSVRDLLGNDRPVIFGLK